MLKNILLELKKDFEMYRQNYKIDKEKLENKQKTVSIDDRDKFEEKEMMKERLLTKKSMIRSVHQLYSLREHAMHIINFEQKKMMPLTNEEY